MGDFRFDIAELPEPESGMTHLVRVFDVDTDEELDAFYSDDPYGPVEAAREAQAIPLEKRWAMYAERGW